MLVSLSISKKSMRKLLVANRSEIAIRVFRAATELDLAHGGDITLTKTDSPCTDSKRMSRT